MGFLHVAVLLLAHAFLASAMVYSYCDLRQPLSDEDPNVFLDTAQSQARFAYPRARIEAALARDSAARAFVQAQALAREQSQQQAANRNPARNAERAPSNREYAAPEAYEGLCDTTEARVLGKLMPGGEFCYVVDPQAIFATACSNFECNVHNNFPFYQKYYCIPDSFVFETALVWCDNDAPTTFETFKIPIQCVCNKHHCNLNGMRLQ